jgi:drug/metabolite transporter (DMT)-like permease
MKTATLAGIVLLVLGVLSLAYQGITGTTHKKVLDVGPIQATEAEKHTLPLPPVLGCLALMGGVVLLAVGTRNESLAR